MTQREVIGISASLASASRRKQHLDRTAVFAAEVIQIGDVVVGLIAKPRQVIAYAKLSRLLITLQRSRKFVQADQAHGHVVQRHRHVFPIFVLGKRFVGALVIGDGLLETILPVKDVADVVIQARQPPPFADLRENLPRAFRRGKRAIVFAKKNQRLNRTAQRARCFPGDFQRFIEVERIFMVLHGPMIVPRSVECVSLRPHGQRDVFLAPKFPGDQQRSFCKEQGLLGIHPDFVHHHGRQALHHFRADEGGIAGEEFPVRHAILEPAELDSQFGFRSLAARPRH